MGFDALAEVLGDLRAMDPSLCADQESVDAVHEHLACLEAIATRMTAAFDAAKGWEASGAKSATQWLATTRRLPKPVAGREVHLGRKLRHLPECERAWLAGEITADHVRTIAAVRNKYTAAALARDEHLLVGWALTMPFEMFQKFVKYWAQRADPDGAEDDEDKRAGRRDAYLCESFEGMWFGKMTFDPIRGTIVSGELDRRETELFNADWAEARARLGREPTVADLARTPGQRRADAFVEMAVRSASTRADARRPAPLFTVLVGYETLHGPICELAGGTPIAPGALLPWLTEAYIERAVFGLDDRVEVSVRSRLFKGATRRALDLRDRQCTHHFCDVTASKCEGDHIIPYSEGGLTTQENGQLRCGFHNRLKQNRPPPADDDPDNTDDADNADGFDSDP